MSVRSTTWLLLAVVSMPVACGPKVPPPPVVELTKREDIDQDVVKLADRLAAAARQRPEDPELRGELAMGLEANEIWNDAVRAWTDALLLAPDRPLWRYHFSLCLKQQGKT